MLHTSRVVKWLMVIQPPIQELNQYSVYEYILIISEYKTTDVSSHVNFNLHAE